MAEEHLLAVSQQGGVSLGLATDEEVLEEIEPIEVVKSDELNPARTGERLRPPPPAGRASVPPQVPSRSSVPPPVPPQARASKPPPSLPPPLRRGGEPTQRGLKPASISRPPPYSGMFRIDRESPSALETGERRPSVPPPPPRASVPPPLPSSSAESADLRRALSTMSEQTREQVSHIHRLRLMVRLREDRVHELETELRGERERVGALESELATLRAQPERAASIENERAERERSAALEQELVGLRAERERAAALEQELVSLRAERQRAATLEQELASLRAERSADDLTRINGIGPGFERALRVIGVASFAQIASWTSSDVERIAREIRTTPRRIARDRWIERARELLAERQT